MAAGVALGFRSLLVVSLRSGCIFWRSVNGKDRLPFPDVLCLVRLPVAQVTIHAKSQRTHAELDAAAWSCRTLKTSSGRREASPGYPSSFASTATWRCSFLALDGYLSAIVPAPTPVALWETRTRLNRVCCCVSCFAARRPNYRSPC